MITKYTISPAGPGTNIPNCTSFRIQSAANGATYRIDGQGTFPIIAGEVYRFPPSVPEVAGKGRRQRWMNHRFPDVFISAGTTVPVTVIASQYDANHGGMTDGLGGGTFPQNQEGDTITGAATTTTPGQVGVPGLWRDPGTPTKFIIPTAFTTNAGQVLVISQPLCASIFDVTSGAGAAVDSGVIVYTSTDSSLMIEIVATAALTGTRTVDVRKVRTDGSQYSLFDPVRNTAATYSLAIGRVNYLACLGVPVGGSAQAAAGTQNSLDHVWGFPLELGGGSGIRVVLTAGGAETVRVRILERRNSAV